MSNTSVNKYVLPITRAKLFRIDRTSSPAHIGKLENAVDLLAPNGTPVLAAADGVVTFVNTSSTLGGADISYWNYSNFIVIMHDNYEYTRYDHLEQGSSKVIVGQQVSAGEEIARTGMTGYTYTPHLHFQVFELNGPNVWSDYKTLRVQFSEL
jgi:murein DD-endopeptidase MepM/ murein hydrolase activator NlpD